MKSIQTKMSEIAYQEWGDQKGVPILAIHGWLDSSASFAPMAPFFEQAGFRLISIDLPGHGHSSWRPEKSVYTFIDYIADITSFLDALSLERVSIIGHSMGGGLASLFSGTFPSRVEKLVLIEALGPVTREPEEAPVNLGNAIRRFLDAKSNSEEGIFRDLNQLVKLRLRAGEMKTESAELLLRRGTEEIGSGYRLRRDPRLNLPSFLRLTERQVLEFLKRIESEVFLIWADNGYQWEKKVIKNRIDSVAKIREVSLPGKHHLHMDQPGEVSQKILEFLGSLKSSGENQSI